MSDLLYIEYGSGWEFKIEQWRLEREILYLKRCATYKHKYPRGENLIYIKQRDMTNILQMIAGFHSYSDDLGIGWYAEDWFSDEDYILPAMALIFGEHR